MSPRAPIEAPSLSALFFYVILWFLILNISVTLCFLRMSFFGAVTVWQTLLLIKIYIAGAATKAKV